mmetsp:Transcript_122548/g.240501  ORF Transcript_122548/g.240501 Transcript_122548/m.240501 type:complete len:228 (-) Transcript_122548:265-948(-)
MALVLPGPIPVRWIAPASCCAPKACHQCSRASPPRCSGSRHTAPCATACMHPSGMRWALRPRRRSLPRYGAKSSRVLAPARWLPGLRTPPTWSRCGCRLPTWVPPIRRRQGTVALCIACRGPSARKVSLACGPASGRPWAAPRRSPPQSLRPTMRRRCSCGAGASPATACPCTLPPVSCQALSRPWPLLRSTWSSPESWDSQWTPPVAACCTVACWIASQRWLDKRA